MKSIGNFLLLWQNTVIKTAYERKVYWDLWFYKVRIHDGGAEAVVPGMPAEAALRAQFGSWTASKNQRDQTRNGMPLDS